jgi:hypothetical protein
MPNPPQDDSHGTIDTEECRLPEPTPAPDDSRARSITEDTGRTLSEEELDRRQAAIGTVRKPSGPPERRNSRAAEADTPPSDVPPTEATPADGDDEAK